MSGGNGGSGGGGDVHGDGGAHVVGLQEPQVLGCQVDQTLVLAPDLVVPRALEAVAVGGVTEWRVGFWVGTKPLWFWP